MRPQKLNSRSMHRPVTQASGTNARASTNHQPYQSSQSSMKPELIHRFFLTFTFWLKLEEVSGTNTRASTKLPI
jgi:hypothetical protein